MRVVVLARTQEDYTSEVETWAADFEYETGEKAELLNPDSIDGEIFATSHDILEFPAVVVVDQNSSILAQWTGRHLPQFEDVTYIMRNI